MLTTSKTIYNKPLTPLHQQVKLKSQSEKYFETSCQFALECGETFNNITISYSTYGRLNKQASNVIWICHALTADANPKDWWSGLIGESGLYNPQDYYIVCANVIGSPYGSTSPLNCDFDKRYGNFPYISIRDNIKAFQQLKSYLEIKKIHTLIGGSMGGHQALEWAVTDNNVCENLILLATSAVMSPWAIAFNQSQRLAIQADQSWGDKSEKAAQNGLKAARTIALLSYRNNEAYNSTQTDSFDFYSETKAISYQNYQGDKLVNRFNAYSYYALTKTMDSHDIGRHRGGIKQALQLIKANTLVIGIDSDLLFPVQESQQLADLIPQAKLAIINSRFGHDGFLIEGEKISSCIKSHYGVKADHQTNKNIGLYGFGCVAQGFYQLLKKSSNTQQIKTIVVKHEYKARKFALDLIATNHLKLIRDKGIKTVVELIDDHIQSYQIAKSSAKQEKNFISANKKMIAYNLPEIIKWNNENNCSFLYEAAVAGSIPILRNLQLYFDYRQTQSVKGIINGSTNYILTQILKNNCVYESALKKAQDLGFAESNPIEDVAGFDAKYKAVILAVHAFGFVTDPDSVPNFGIQHIQPNDIEFAQSRNMTIKHIVTLNRSGPQGIAISIMPHFINRADEMAKIDGTDNLIIVNNNQTDCHFKGAGAGSIATGTAVMADLKAVSNHYKYNYKVNDDLCIDNHFRLKIYLNKKNYSGPVQGNIIEETNDYIILDTSYDELIKMDNMPIFLAKID